MEGVHFSYLGGAKGGATVGLYQNGGYDEQRNEHIDTKKWGCGCVKEMW